MANMIKVQYVGVKEFALDNVARSGATWHGKDSVSEVTPRQAKLLIAYTDQWALFDEKDRKRVMASDVVETEDQATGQITRTKVDTFMGMNVEKMTAAQLVAFAMHKYGKVLKSNRARKVMLDEVVEMGATPSL